MAAHASALRRHWYAGSVTSMTHLAHKPKPIPEHLSVPVNFRLSERAYEALQALAAKQGL